MCVFMYVFVFVSVFVCVLYFYLCLFETLTRKLRLASDVRQSSQVLELKGFTTTPIFIMGY